MKGSHLLELIHLTEQNLEIPSIFSRLCYILTHFRNIIKMC